MLLIASQPPWSLGWLALVALVPLLLALRGAGLRARLGLGWLCGTVWSFGMVGVWLWPAARQALDAGPLVSFLVAVAATQLYGGLHMVAFAALAGGCGGRPWRVAATWVAVEVLRSAALGGIAWGLLGHALWNHPSAIQAAAVFGVAGVSFWLAVVNAAVANALAGADDDRRKAVAVAAAVVVAVIGYGWWRLSWPAPPGGFAVRVVYSDWPSLDRDRAGELVDRLVRTTAAAPGAAELTVWPEASLRTLPTVHPQQARAIYEVAEDLDRPLIFGGPRAQQGALFNSLYLLRPATSDLVATYDKRRLVPLAESHFTAGSSAAAFRTGGGGTTAAPLLCFEALFPDLAVRADADVLLNPTNDVRVGAGAGQQAAMAVFRAVENGIPLLRIANRGPSMLVDGRGRILRRARGWGAAIWPVPARLPSTTYRQLVGWLGAIVPARAAAEGPLGWACLSWLVAGWLRRSRRAANETS